MPRIAVVGTSGSGKTTFATALAERLGVPRVELDALFWEPGWAEPDLATFRARVSEAIAPDDWVLDGNYSRVRDLYVARADTIVWLDLSLRVCLWRVARRAITRARTREELWGSNRETWRKLLSRDSLIWWVLTTHGQRRRENEARFSDPAFAAVDVLRFRSSAAAEAWLAGLPESPNRDRSQ